MNIIRYLIALPSYIFFNNTKKYFFHHLKLQKKIIYLLKKKKKISNLTETHKKFNQEVINILLNKKLFTFLRQPFIQKMFFVHNRLFILKELNYLKAQKEWNLYKKLLNENDAGNPVRYIFYPKSSGNRINHIFHISTLAKHMNIDLKKINHIYEFGGGYGCMLDIFFKINKKINYTIFDTFHVNLIQYYYLSLLKLKPKLGYDRKHNISLENDTSNIKKYIISSKKYLFMANWSLSETPIKFRKKFLNLIFNSEYILISFQEKFEDINNLKYFNLIKLKLSKKFEIKIIENEYYKGNIFNKQRHFYFIGKRKR